MGRTRYTLRRILGDWRLYLLLALLLAAFYFGLVSRLGAQYRYRHFAEIARFANVPAQAALQMGVEGQFDTMEQVWEAYVDAPDKAEYYYLALLCNASAAGTLASILFSFWIIGRSILGRHASELLLRGAGRPAAFCQLLFPYLGASLLLRWGFFALCFAVLPIRVGRFPPGYFPETALIWLLLSAADTAFFGFIAFAFHPYLALGVDMGAAVLVLLLPGSLRRLLPMAALNETGMWKMEALPGPRQAAAIVAGVIFLASLLGAWLAFRRKDLN